MLDPMARTRGGLPRGGLSGTGRPPRGVANRTRPQPPDQEIESEDGDSDGSIIDIDDGDSEEEINNSEDSEQGSIDGEDSKQVGYQKLIAGVWCICGEEGQYSGDISPYQGVVVINDDMSAVLWMPEVFIGRASVSTPIHRNPNKGAVVATLDHCIGNSYTDELELPNFPKDPYIQRHQVGATGDDSSYQLFMDVVVADHQVGGICKISSADEFTGEADWWFGSKIDPQSNLLPRLFEGVLGKYIEELQVSPGEAGPVRSAVRSLVDKSEGDLRILEHLHGWSSHLSAATAKKKPKYKSMLPTASSMDLLGACLKEPIAIDCKLQTLASLFTSAFHAARASSTPPIGSARTASSADRPGSGNRPTHAYLGQLASLQTKLSAREERYKVLVASYADLRQQTKMYTDKHKPASFHEAAYHAALQQQIARIQHDLSDLCRPELADQVEADAAVFQLPLPAGFLDPAVAGSATAASAQKQKERADEVGDGGRGTKRPRGGPVDSPSPREDGSFADGASKKIL